MVVSNPVVNELRTLLSAKKGELYQLEQEFEGRVKSLRDDIAAVERTLGLYQTDKPVESENQESLTRISIRELRRLGTQKKALDYIAGQNDGCIKVSEAKQLLIEAGLIKGQHKYAYGHIYNMLNQDERYIKIGEGKFIRQQHSLNVSGPSGSEMNDTLKQPIMLRRSGGNHQGHL